MIEQVYTALLEPLTNSEAWYGVFLALAFRKQVRRLVEWNVGQVKQRVGNSG